MAPGAKNRPSGTDARELPQALRACAQEAENVGERAAMGKHVQSLSRGAAVTLQHGKSDVGKLNLHTMLRSGLEMEADA